MSEPTTHTLAITNGAANLLALLLNQDGWVKGVDELIITGDLLKDLPDERPIEDADTWDKQPFTAEISAKQFKAAKHCFTAIAEKGNLSANQNVLLLAEVLGFTIPQTEPSISITLPQISAKYLADIFTMQGKVKKVEDLIDACQVNSKIPVLDGALMEKGRERDLRAWMETSCELLITDRQRDTCRQVLKAAAEGGDVKANKYIPVLYTEFGLRE
jgi:hypothetical protein